jgi:hypothetical protein
MTAFPAAADRCNHKPGWPNSSATSTDPKTIAAATELGVTLTEQQNVFVN